LVAAPFPPGVDRPFTALARWLERVRQNPTAGLLAEVPDHEL